MINLGKIILYHGTPERYFIPTFGKGENKHDCGKGFYLTENLELAKEWAVCRPENNNGWVHKYELDCTELRILDFKEYDVLTWLAELMKHRAASDSKRYRILSERFIEKYGVDTEKYDVIKGWRANASYFYIAKEFVRDNVDIDILEELLSLGGLGVQLANEVLSVEYEEFNNKYNLRDITARNKMRELIESDKNKLTNVFSDLI